MDFATLALTDLQTAYEATTPEAVELRSLLNNIEAHRRLRFSRQEAETTYPTLLASGQLAPDSVTYNGTQIAITDTPLFYCGLYRTLGHRFQYTLTADLGAAYSFLEQAESFIFENGRNHGGNKVIRGLMEWLLHFAIQEYGANLSSFLLGVSFKRGTTLKATLLECLLGEPFLASLPIDQAWPIYRHFAEDLGEPDPNVHDLVWNHLQGAVQVYAREHPNEAEETKRFALQDLSTRPAYYISLAAFIGLWEAGPFSLSELLSWLDQPEKRNPALTLLRIMPFKTAADRQAILEKLATITLPADELFNLPTLYVNFINAADSTETDILQQCHTGLATTLKSQDHGLVRVSLTAITRLQKDIAPWMDKFIALTRSGQYDDSYTPMVNGLFGAHPMADKFGEFVAAYASIKDSRANYDVFQYALHMIQQASQQDLDHALVTLMTHDQGTARWAGHQLYYSLFQHGQRATLAFDLLTLPEQQQARMAVSFLQPFQPVPLTIPPCIPLLRSPHPRVRQLVQQRLLDLTYSYRNEIVEEVNSLLPADFPDRAAIIDPLQVASNALLAETQTKVVIRELDPRETEPAQWRTYLQAFYQRTRQSFRMMRKRQGGIMALAHEVPITRGGGWKPTSDGPIQQLGDFHFELPMSRLGVLRPEAMEEQFHDLFTADWQTDFETWAQKAY